MLSVSTVKGALCVFPTFSAIIRILKVSFIAQKKRLDILDICSSGPTQSILYHELKIRISPAVSRAYTVFLCYKSLDIELF